LSSSHLILSSPFFRKLLTGGWKESKEFQEKGFIEVQAEGWDVDAFTIVMQVLHCQHHKMTKFFDVDLLGKVAVIADFYGCQDAMRTAAIPWLVQLPKTFPPTTTYRELLLWVWISYFYQLTEHFRWATSAAMTRGKGRINALGLPLPSHILAAIDSKRQAAISDLIDLVWETRDKYVTHELGCCYECSSMMAGCIEHNMAVLATDLKKPYEKFSHASLINRINKFRSPRWCH
ncbi:hypothetical protein BO70DRAFT_261278, partial [Aspergillus heteromorphus CBS 117.55]